MTRPFENKTLALCVTGSIAAYKGVLLARLLVLAGAKVYDDIPNSSVGDANEFSLYGLGLIVKPAQNPLA